MEKLEQKVVRTENAAMKCSSKWCVFVIIFMFPWLVDSKMNACSSNLTCRCKTETERPSVVCRNKKLNEVVYGIPRSIVTLDLSFNRISKIQRNDFLGLEKLETLFLMNNKITEIHAEAFRNLYNLKLLVLENNKLTTISDSLFQHLPNVEDIKLHKNEITTISRHAFISLPLNPVPKIELSDNPIQCDCEIKALKQWMTDNPHRIQLNSAKCSNTPSKVEIKDTPDSEFPTCSDFSCEEESVSTLVGNFNWPVTPSGKIARSLCPNNSKQYAYRRCKLTKSIKGSWLETDLRACLINVSIGDDLLNLLNIKVTAANVANVANNLKTITANSRDFNTAQLSLAVNVLERILKENSFYDNLSVMNVTVAVVSQLLTSKDNVLKEAEQKYRTSSKILHSVDAISNKVNLKDGTVKIVQPNLVLAAVPIVDGIFSGLTITANSKLRILSDFKVKRAADDDDEMDMDNDNDRKDEIVQTATDRSREDDEDDENNDYYYTSTLNPMVNDNEDDDLEEEDLEEEEEEDLEEEDDEDNDESSSFALPKTLFSGLSKAEKNAVERITFHAFPTGRLFSSIGSYKSYEHFQPISDNKFVTEINSGVLSVSVTNVKIRQLQDPVHMTFSHSSKNSTNARCVFWDDGIVSGKEGWSSEGCQVLTNIQGSHTTCVCDHLTNFALLMDVYQDGNRISEKDRTILSIISYIGCTLSFTCLALTVLTYMFFKKLRKENPSKILFNLCIALAIADLIFIIGMHRYAMNDSLGCKVVAILLHYFLLSALSWMSVEAFYMYLALVLVFKTYYSKFMFKCAAVGWGIPFVVVVITLSVSTENYSYLDSGICWLTPNAFYGAFAAPVLIVLLINFVAFGLVLRLLCGLQAKKLTKSDRSDKLSKVRGAVGVVTLLGLTWIFAIFAIDSMHTVFTYLFAIFNALQGMFIFMFYCLFKKDARKAWKILLPCCEVVDEKSSRRGYFGSTPSSNCGKKTLSNYNGLTSVKIGSGKYEVSPEDNARYDQNNHNDNADYNYNNVSLDFDGYKNTTYYNRPASSTYI